jgi:hypothetical protein
MTGLYERQGFGDGTGAGWFIPIDVVAFFAG